MTGPNRDAALGDCSSCPIKREEHLQALVQIGDPTARRDAIDGMMEYAVRYREHFDDTRAAIEKADIPDE